MISSSRLVFVLLFAAMFLSFARPHSLLAQNTPAASDSLAAQVDAAMESARKHDFKPTYALYLPADQVVPLLGKYTHDPDPAIQRSLSFFAESSHSPQSMKILSALSAELHEQSVDDIYWNYSSGEIRQWGGIELKQNLLKYLYKAYLESGSPSSVKALVMLLSFSPDADVRAFLENLRANDLTYTRDVFAYGQTVKRVFRKQTSLPYSNPVDLALPVDIALSEQGDQAAMERVKQSIQHGDVDSTLIFVLGTTRFLKQRPVLRELVELLKDKRHTEIGYKIIIEPDAAPSAPPSPAPPKAAATPAEIEAASDLAKAVAKEDNLRICDLALAALVENTGVDVGIPDLMLAIKKNPRTFPKRLYTDAELNRAYLLLKGALSPGPVLSPVKLVQPKQSLRTKPNAGPK